MTNIYDYVKKYGKYTYEELEFNDLDNLVPRLWKNKSKRKYTYHKRNRKVLSKNELIQKSCTHRNRAKASIQIIRTSNSYKKIWKCNIIKL